MTLNSFIVHTPAAKAGGGGGGGSTPLFGLSDYVQENRVWFLGPQGSSLEQGVQIYYLAS